MSTEMKEVEAIEQGYDNIKVREPGERFHMPVGASAPWFKDVEPAAESVQQTSATKSADDGETLA